MKNESMMPSYWIMAVALLVSFAITQVIWGGVIRPNAEYILQAGGTAALTSVFVILKDWEQQICFSLMLFCIYLMFHKIFKMAAEKPICTHDFLEDFPKDAPLDVDKALNALESSIFREKKVTLTWIDTLRRFKVTANVQDAAEAIGSSVDSLANNIESENSMVRYIIWAIPSIGFIGTVRGIGQALAQAEQALEGNIAGMTASLGVAFNSTLVALFISILLMFIMHIMGRQQDLMIIRTEDSCKRYLLSHLHNQSKQD